MLESDRVCRFLLDERPVRGQAVRLEASWSALLEHADYPPAVRILLGEAVVASVLLAATLKFEGALTLQLQGNGRVSLLVAQCTHDFRVRAMAQFDTASDATGFRALVGDGNMAVTVEADDREARYQGVVPLAGESLAESLEEYFDRSEQIPSIVRLTATAEAIAGVLVQRLPETGALSTDVVALDELWLRLAAAVHTMPSETVLEPAAEVVVRAAMAGEDARLFAAQPVEFECRCSAERVAALLRSLGEREVREVLAEEGAVTVTCEFCHRPYAFDSIEVERLFASVDMAPGTDSIN
ncbi:MAG TPA: Hsp33 family molecular chaperone HslO [Steroidobacteraceae bacterium]|nr:Hsp33 family molecular chaperone HslO [Steroidobacteraceae bacterium]